MKKIKTKNYFLLIFIFALTFIICIYLFSWIKQYRNIKYQTSVITSSIHEIKYNNLQAMVKENDFFVLYTCNNIDKKCRMFSKNFKNYIDDNNLNEKIIYYNLENEKPLSNITTLYNEYKGENLLKKLNNYPSILIFNKGKIIDFLVINDKTDIDDVNEFLKGYDMV